MKMATEENGSSAHCGTVVKQEPVEVDPLTSKRETEYIAVNEDALFLQESEVPDGHVSEQDPLSIVKEVRASLVSGAGTAELHVPKLWYLHQLQFLADQETLRRSVTVSSLLDDMPFGEEEKCKSSEDFILARSSTIEKTKGEEHEENPVSCDDTKERSSRDDVPGPSTFGIEAEEEEEAESEDHWEEIKHELESTSSVSESTVPSGVEDNTSNDDSSCLFTNVSLAAGTDDTVHSNTKQETSCVNEIGTRHLGHKSVQEIKERMHINRQEHHHMCIVCHKTFLSNSSLKRHMVVHTDKRPYSCGVCNKTFTRNYYLKEHSRLHTGEHPYKCSVCEKTFRVKTGLMEHSRLHGEERPLSCKVCNKTFILRYNLERHLSEHIVGCPYSCGTCNKTFKYFSALKRHTELHTTECPYRCDVCNKTFKYLSTLKRHRQLHTAERPYSCGVCHKTFKRNSHLKRHMRLHTGERTHSCGVCNKAFVWESSLKQHLRSHTVQHQ